MGSDFAQLDPCAQLIPMDAYEVTRVVYSRLQAMEPEHVTKIMGFLLLQDGDNQEMLRLACSPDAVLQALVHKVKKDLGLHSSSSLLLGTALHISTGGQPSLYHGRQIFNSLLVDDSTIPAALPESSLHGFANRYGFPEDTFPLSFLNESSPGFYENFMPPDAFSMLQPKLNTGIFQLKCGNRFSGNDLQVPAENIAWKPCLYYARGYCKHGNACKFLHINSVREDTNFLLSPSSVQSQDSGSDDGLMPGSLERLEIELQELLRGRKAPLSIAALPQLYYERFGKTLQADGYLTESQRHGKAGYSLTKLLARLKSSITLIDRPHGQHAVVLSEDAHKFTAYRETEKDFDSSSVVNPGSRQIYLTFPPDSAFTEEDVSAHFRAYGPVQDVRIPFQQKRMFGFVTFVYSETVKMILAKGNPHFICGARVLVKPYKEKGKPADRKHPDQEFFRLLGPPSVAREYDYVSGPRFFMKHDMFQRQLNEERILEAERRNFLKMQLEKQRRQQLQSQSFFVPFPPPVLPSLVPAMSFTSSFSAPTVSTFVDAYTCVALNSTASSTSDGTCVPVDGARNLDKEDLQPVKMSNQFAAVDGMEERKQNTQSNDQESCHLDAVTEKDTGDNKQDENTLPDSPFRSPHKPYTPTPPSTPPLSDPMSNNLLIRSLSLNGPPPPPGFSLPSMPAAGKCNSCCICKGVFIDYVELDCGHACCAQCILKVAMASKDECPICQMHISSHNLKLIEMRCLQALDLW